MPECCRCSLTAGDVLVFMGQDPPQHFQHRDSAPEALPQGGELKAGGAGADHHHRRGGLGEVERLAHGDDGFIVVGDAGNLPGDGSKGEDDVFS